MITYSVLCGVQHNRYKEVIKLLNVKYVHTAPYEVITVDIVANVVTVDPRCHDHVDDGRLSLLAGIFQQRYVGQRALWEMMYVE